MHKCSNVLLLLAATDVIMGHIAFQAQGDLLELYAALADAFHELVTALMVRHGSKSFRAVFETHGHDIRNLLAGMVNLSNVVLEIAVISCWLVGGAAHGHSTTRTHTGGRASGNGNRAVAVDPGSVRGTLHGATLSFPHLHPQVASILTTGLRVATWGRPAVARTLTAAVLHASHALKASVQWVFHMGGLLRRNVGQPMRRAKRRIKQSLSNNDGASIAHDARRRLVRHATRRSQYEFSKEQEQVFRNVLAAIRICSLAKFGQGLSELALVAAHVATRQWSQAVAGVFDTLDAMVVAGLLMLCMRSFEGIIRTSGQDISLLLEGLGPKHGVAKLFGEFADVALFLVRCGRCVSVITCVHLSYRRWRRLGRAWWRWW